MLLLGYFLKRETWWLVATLNGVSGLVATGAVVLLIAENSQWGAARSAGI
jgi:hypothetical protein